MPQDLLGMLAALGASSMLMLASLLILLPSS